MDDYDAAAANNDFDGGVFARIIPEDCVKYSIFVINSDIKDALGVRQRLKVIQDAAALLTKDLLPDYIWQRDGFNLTLRRARETHPTGSTDDGQQQDLTSSATLEGTTNFGDSIADEWLVVYLLLELSKKFSDIWIRVVDTDGEFLLIEAANALPKWLNPEIADNRVWLNDGKIKIIPLAEGRQGNQSFNLDLHAATNVITKNAAVLEYSQSIQDEAFYRLRDYPAAINSNLHNAVLRLPRSVAYILQQHASYISPAIESFYLRDPISLKPLATKDTATLFFPPEDIVNLSVKFTKVGYAQLRSQDFAPPPSWTSITPHLDDPRVTTGMKLACGFEMLLQDKSNTDKRVVREIKLLLNDIETGDATLPSDVEIAALPQTQDDERWLDIDFADLERELDGKKRDGGSTAKTPSASTTDADAARETGGGFGDKAAQENLRKMVSRFEAFLEDDSAGLDGANGHNGDGRQDRDEMDFDNDDSCSSVVSSSSSSVSSSGEDKTASFDEAEFESAMREMMGMPPDEIASSGLLDEARRLALEMEDEDEGLRDEDEEAREIMALMEKELRGHGALDVSELKARAESAGQKGFIAAGRGKGPERIRDPVEGEELSSSDEEGLEENEVDVELVRNMLEAFKTQGGLAGPAGNMLAAMGIKLPRDDGETMERSKTKK